MRLFLGIFPPKETLDQFRDLLRLYDKHKRNLIPLPVDQLHVTIKYIGGEVSQDSLKRIVDDLYLKTPPGDGIDIVFKDVRFGFEFDSVPKILIAPIEATPQLVTTANFFHENIKYLHLDDTIRWKNKFANTFHISLAKLKDTVSRNAGKQMKEFTKTINLPKIKTFHTKEIYLVESIVRTGKPIIYRKLEKFNI